MWLDCCYLTLVVYEASERISPLPEAILPVVAGQIIGERYLIGSVIGEGGMGVVCAATHVGLGTPVAVKLIRSDLKHDHESVLRFMNEARTAASLKGDHVARVYDVGQLDSGEPYLVMEQLEGMALDVFIEERAPLAQSEAVDIVLQACEGLAEAHAVALVHRDIKPANLFLARRPDGQFILKILDFGIAKRLIEGARRGLTDPGRSIGSPWYMSPEQMMNASLVDQRADIWSLGVLLYQLLTNQYPFNGEGVVQVCANVLTVPAPAPSALRTETDAHLDAIVLRCLEKNPEERYASVIDLAEALRPFGSRPALASVPAPASLLAAPTLALVPAEAIDVDHPPPRRAREAATPESLERVAPELERSRGSPVTVALVSLAIGVAVSWFGWPYVHEHYHVPNWKQLSRSRLPWDPVLAPGPFYESTRFEREFEPIASAGPDSASGSGVARTSPFATPSASQPLTPAEIRRRTARYENWLRTQGVAGLKTAPTDSTAPTDNTAPINTDSAPLKPADNQAP